VKNFVCLDVLLIKGCNKSLYANPIFKGMLDNGISCYVLIS
jgi:hypothetical protein